MTAPMPSEGGFGSQLMHLDEKISAFEKIPDNWGFASSWTHIVVPSLKEQQFIAAKVVVASKSSACPSGCCVPRAASNRIVEPLLRPHSDSGYRA